MPVRIRVSTTAQPTIKRTTKKLDKFEKKVPKVLTRHINALGLDIRNHAIRSIVQGSPKGRVYIRGSRSHRASAPGQPPASDTGDLQAHIFVEPGRRGKDRFVDIGTTKQHGLFLELGTTRVAARPWLQPAYDAQSKGADRKLIRRLEREVV